MALDILLRNQLLEYFMIKRSSSWFDIIGPESMSYLDVLSSYNYSDTIDSGTKQMKLTAAKYILEYLYSEHSCVLGNNGHTFNNINKSCGRRIYDYTNIMALNECTKLHIMMIARIVESLYKHPTDVVKIDIKDMQLRSFLNWAKNTELEGSVVITAVNDKSVISGSELYVWREHEEFMSDTQKAVYEKANEELLRLTPERERMAYNDFRFDNYCSDSMTEISFISISRSSGGKLKFSSVGEFYPTDNAKLLADIIAEDIKEKPITECLILSYKCKDFPERLLYNEDSNFYGAFYYKDGKVAIKEKNVAFEYFHKLYCEMTEQ